MIEGNGTSVSEVSGSSLGDNVPPSEVARSSVRWTILPRQVVKIPNYYATEAEPESLHLRKVPKERVGEELREEGHCGVG